MTKRGEMAAEILVVVVLAAVMAVAVLLTRRPAAAELAPPEARFEVYDQADPPLRMDRITGQTWTKACPGAPASCRWVPVAEPEPGQ